jgi:hypothetical protein
MQEAMNIKPNTTPRTSSEPHRREDLGDQLLQLRDELARRAHDLRMKSKGSSSEVHDTRRMLEREAQRFSVEVEEAVERTQRDLINAGKALQMRFQALANQIAMPPS